MAIKTYQAITKTWLSNDCRMVEAGDIFTSDFGDMKLGDNLKLVEEKQDDDHVKRK